MCSARPLSRVPSFSSLIGSAYFFEAPARLRGVRLPRRSARARAHAHVRINAHAHAHAHARPRPGRRKNTTAQYLSWKTAVTHGCWATDPHKQAADPRCAERVTELRDDWPQFQTRVDQWYATSEASCRAAGRPVTFLSMEDYLAPRWQTYEQEVAKLTRNKGLAKDPV